MPKIKTRRAMAKRLKVTGSGKLMHDKANKGHLLTKKSTKRKREFWQVGMVAKSENKKVRRMVPYL